MLIDSHAHLNFKAFDKDCDEVIKKCLSEDVWMINVGSKYSTSKKAIAIAEKYDNIYAAVGLHPIHAQEPDDISELAKHEKVKAIGEIGLDYFRDYGEFKDKQKQVFIKQLDLAKELNLPVIIHCRMAHDDVLEILKEYNLKGVIHCFTGTWEQAQEYMSLGYYIGINGILYKFDLKKIIEKTPLDRILLETDCPYLGKEQRNEPTFVREIAKEIARIKNISFDEVARTTFQNTVSLFNL